MSGRMRRKVSLQLLYSYALAGILNLSGAIVSMSRLNWLCLVPVRLAGWSIGRCVHPRLVGNT